MNEGIWSGDMVHHSHTDEGEGDQENGALTLTMGRAQEAADE